MEEVSVDRAGVGCRSGVMPGVTVILLSMGDLS